MDLVALGLMDEILCKQLRIRWGINLHNAHEF